MPRRVKGCYNCSQRRISCDRARPQCQKCLRAGLECPGLGVRYRWTEPARAWPKPRRSAPSTPRVVRAAIQYTDDSADGGNNMTVRPVQPRTLDLTFMLPDVVTGPATNYQDFWILNYFAEQICPLIYPFYNGRDRCEKHLVSLALTSTELFNAIAALSLHRLAYYGGPEIESKAESYKSLAIEGLRQNADYVCSSEALEHPKLAAMAAIIIFVYDDMVSAQNYFPTLIPIMRTFAAAFDPAAFKERELMEFLREELGLLLVLCIPYQQEFTLAARIEDALSFLQGFEQAAASHHGQQATFLIFCLRQTVLIWQIKCLNPGHDTDALLMDLKNRINGFPELADVDHYLTWVYFISAAAASDGTLRDYYYSRLSNHAVSHEWKNIKLMLRLLPVLWRTGSTWPSYLLRHTEFICA